MSNPFKSSFKKWAGALLLFYLAGGLLLYLFQEVILFHGQPLPRQHPYPFKTPHEEVFLRQGSNTTHFVRFPIEKAKGIVLFFHGNRRNLWHYRQYPYFFLRKGYELWMIDYPGFGKSTGERTEQRLYSDALNLYQEAKKVAGNRPILIYGKSMGTGVASYLAAERPCRQLILETPYQSIGALARHYFPVYPAALLSKYALPTEKQLAKVAAPVTILHGTRDEVIPYQQAEKLQQLYPGIGLVRFEGGSHNELWTMPLFHRTLDSLLKE